MKSLPNPFMPASAGLASRLPAVGQASPRQQTARGRGEVLARFVLDEERFMEAIEPPPLFLQRDLYSAVTVDFRHWAFRRVR
jgi:hypothetical protein